MDQDDELAQLLVLVALHPADKLRQRAVTNGLELLGQLARQHRPAPGPEDVGHVRQAFENTVRTFVENQRARLGTQLFEHGAARGRPGRREPLEHETVGRKAGSRQRRDRRAGARHRDHGNARLSGGAHQVETGVAYQRGTCIGDKCDRLTFSQNVDEPGNLAAFVMLMESFCSGANTEMHEKPAAVARILGGDQIGLGKHARRARRHVFQVADGRGHDIERAGV